MAARASGLTLPQHVQVEVEDARGRPVIKIAKNAMMLSATNASQKKPRSGGGVSPAATCSQSQRLSWASNCPSL